MATRMEKRRELEQRTESFIKSVTEARSALDEVIDAFEASSYDDGFDAYERADEHMERATRRASRVADAFDDYEPPAPRRSRR